LLAAGGGGAVPGTLNVRVYSSNSPDGRDLMAGNKRIGVFATTKFLGKCLEFSILYVTRNLQISWKSRIRLLYAPKLMFVGKGNAKAGLVRGVSRV
jgi:hypothetical protein